MEDSLKKGRNSYFMCAATTYSYHDKDNDDDVDEVNRIYKKSFWLRAKTLKFYYSNIKKSWILPPLPSSLMRMTLKFKDVSDFIEGNLMLMLLTLWLWNFCNENLCKSLEAFFLVCFWGWGSKHNKIATFLTWENRIFVAVVNNNLRTLWKKLIWE